MRILKRLSPLGVLMAGLPGLLLAGDLLQVPHDASDELPPQTSGGCPLADCTITFDFGEPCPNVTPVCGAAFAGGNGCVIDFLKFCYSTGEFAYRINPASPLTINLAEDLLELEVFFANVSGSSGEMRFFNAQDQEVDSPLLTNGACNLLMPPTQTRTFEEPVRRIEVTASGLQVYIDSLRVNPGLVLSPADLDGDCVVDSTDLALLLGQWGPCPGCTADLNGDNVVDSVDLALLLGDWTT